MGSPSVTAPVFGLRKSWLDPGPGIAMVQVHYTCSPTGTAPDWTDAEVRGELLILLLGRDLAAKVLEASLAPNGSHVTSSAS